MYTTLYTPGILRVSRRLLRFARFKHGSARTGASRDGSFAHCLRGYEAQTPARTSEQTNHVCNPPVVILRGLFYTPPTRNFPRRRSPFIKGSPVRYKKICIIARNSDGKVPAIDTAVSSPVCDTARLRCVVNYKINVAHKVTCFPRRRNYVHNSCGIYNIISLSCTRTNAGKQIRRRSD